MIVFVIADIVNLPDGNLVLAVNFSSSELKEEFSRLDNDTTKKSIEEKQFWFDSGDRKISVLLLDVEVSASLINFKNIFLTVEKTKDTQSLQIQDEVYTDLKN